MIEAVLAAVLAFFTPAPADAGWMVVVGATTTTTTTTTLPAYPVYDSAACGCYQTPGDGGPWTFSHTTGNHATGRKLVLGIWAYDPGDNASCIATASFTKTYNGDAITGDAGDDYRETTTASPDLCGSFTYLDDPDIGTYDISITGPDDSGGDSPLVMVACAVSIYNAEPGAPPVASDTGASNSGISFSFANETDTTNDLHVVMVGRSVADTAVTWDATPNPTTERASIDCTTNTDLQGRVGTGVVVTGGTSAPNGTMGTSELVTWYGAFSPYTP